MLALLLMPLKTYADTSASTNYRVDETFFGSGGELNACSTGPNGYCSKQTAGELTVGRTDGTLYRAYAGFNTTDEPFLEFVVTAASIDLGYLDENFASTGSGQFYVRAWQAEGYVVRTVSDPPSNGSHLFTTLAAPAGSSPGTEQFGINLVDNSSPNVGANPTQANSFSYGQAETNYDTPNQFTYNKGDVIARSTQSSSVTIYTISYLFNISPVTPSGLYTFNHVLVATGTY